MFYFVRTPGWLKKIYSNSLWQVPGTDKTIYLTFDDGPHPSITSFVLDELKKYNAKATFFCIGNNVVKYPDTYARILNEGHAVGNHTFNHLNGWKTSNEEYLRDIKEAKKHIDSVLFRPPYGRITRFQQKILTGAAYGLKTVMWTVLSGDFDPAVTPEKCLKNVMQNTSGGAIVVYHDSEKAAEKMRYSLPIVLKHFSKKGYRFEKIKN